MARVGTGSVSAAVFALVLAVFVSGSVQAQSDEAAALDRRVIELHRAGKAAEAIPLAKRALEMREKALPAGHPDIAASLNNLAFLYGAQGRMAHGQDTVFERWTHAGVLCQFGVRRRRIQMPCRSGRGFLSLSRSTHRADLKPSAPYNTFSTAKIDIETEWRGSAVDGQSRPRPGRRNP